MRYIVFILLLIVTELDAQNINQLKPDTAAGSIPMTVAPYFRQAYVRPQTLADTLAPYLSISAAGDSLGTPFQDTRLILGDGTRGGKTDSQLTFASNILHTSHSIVLENPAFGSTATLFKDATTLPFTITTSAGNIHLNAAGYNTAFSATDGSITGIAYAGGGLGGTPNRLTGWGAGGNLLSVSSADALTFLGIDGSETSVTAGTNISVTGSGTTGSPYVITNTGYTLPALSTNHITYYNGSNLATDFGDLVWNPDGGGAGIGRMSLNTATPSYTLDVRGAEGTGYFSGFLELDGGIKDAGGNLGTSGQILQSTGSDVVWATNTAYALPSLSTNHIVYYNGSDLSTDFGDLVWNPDGGGAGIGRMSLNTATPSYTLHVVGDGYFTDFLELDGGIKDAAGNLGTSGQILASTGGDVAWIDNPVYALPSLSTNHIVYYNGSDLATDFGDLVWDPDGGGAGVGRMALNTSTPAYSLDIRGAEGTGYFSGFLELDGGIKDAAGNLGTSGQVLTSTGADVSWASFTSSLWTDAGSYSYLTSTSDNVSILKSSTPTAGLDVNGSAHFGATSTTANKLEATISDGSYAKIGRTSSNYMLFRSDATNDTEIYADAELVMDLTGSSVQTNANMIIGNSTADQLSLLSNAGYAWIGHEDFSAANGDGIVFRDNTTSDLELYADNELVVDIEGANVQMNADLKVGNSTADQLQVSTSATYAQIGHEAATSSYLRFDESSNINVAAAASMTLASTTGMTITNSDANGITLASGGITDILDDAKIGGNSGDQLEITTTSTAVTIGHDTELANSYIKFNDASSSGNIDITSSGNVAIDADLNAFLNSNGTGSGGKVFINGNGADVLVNSVTSNSGTANFEVGGSAYKSDGSTAWLTTSDKRVKKDIKTIKDPLVKLMQIRPVEYKFKNSWIQKNNLKDDKVHRGFIAQEYREIFPEDVEEGEDYGGSPLLQMAPDAILPYLVAAVQELKKENEELKLRLDNMEKRIK